MVFNFIQISFLVNLQELSLKTIKKDPIKCRNWPSCDKIVKNPQFWTGLKQKTEALQSAFALIPTINYSFPIKSSGKKLAMLFISYQLSELW